MNLTIYIDVLFLINFILDYIILATTAFLNEKKPNTYRLLAAASVGAVYNVIIFFPRLSILNIFAFRVLISFLINLIAFKYLNLVNYCKNILVYYIINAVYGGGIYAFYNFTVLGSKMNFSNGVYYIDLPLWAILILVLSMYWLIRFLSIVFEKRSVQKNIRKIKISLLNISITVDALFDTGNSLCDPISLSPVMLVQADCFIGKLQEGILKEIESQNYSSLTILHKIYPELKFRVIPFKDITGNKNNIFAFKPDAVLDLDKNRIISNVLVGIINTELSNDKTYNALLNSRI